MKCIVCLFSTQVDRDIMTTDRCFGVKVDYHPSLYDGIQYSSEIDGITGHIGHFDLYGVSSMVYLVCRLIQDTHHATFSAPFVVAH